MPESMRRRRAKANNGPGGARLVLVTSLLLGWMQATSTSAFVVPAPAAAGSFCGECDNKQVRAESSVETWLSVESLLFI